MKTISKKEEEILLSIIAKYYYPPKEEKQQKSEKKESNSAVTIIMVLGVIITIILFLADKVEIGLLIFISSIILAILFGNMEGKDKATEIYIIPNPEKINKIKLFRIPVHCEKMLDKKYFLTDVPVFELTKTEYPMLKEYKRVNELIEEMSLLKDTYPKILDGARISYDLHEDSSYGSDTYLRGEEGELADCFNEFTKLLQNRYKIPLNLNIVKPSIIGKFLEYNGRARRSGSNSIIIDTIRSEEGRALEEKLELWLKEWESINALLALVRFKSLNEDLSVVSQELNYGINYSAFNFYCPECNIEKTQSFLKRDYTLQGGETSEPFYLSKNSRCSYNPKTAMWKCVTCEKEYEQPIPMHKAFDELLHPVYVNLMDENKNDRVKVHKDTMDREIMNQNEMEKELEKINYDNINTIIDLSNNLENFNAEIAGENEAILSFGEITRLYKIEQSEVLEKITQFSVETQKEISRLTEQSLQHVDNIKNNAMKELNEQLTEISKAKRQEELMRDMVQLQILNTCQENLNVTRQGFQNLDNKLGTINDSINRGFSSVNKNLRLGNSISAAIGKGLGINLHDHAPWRLDKTIKNFGAEISGSLLGKPTYEREGDKFYG